MTKEIAVLADHEGLLSSFFKPGIVRMYEKDCDQWKLTKEHPFLIEREKGINAVRQSISEIVQTLGRCKVIVGLEFSGAPYTILDSAGFTMYEAEGVAEKILDCILEKEKNGSHSETEVLSNEKIEVKAYPVETEVKGSYFIDLKQLQSVLPDISSKKALLPFIRNESFYEIKVICAHIPPWFDIELDRLGLKFEANKISENNYIVKVYKKTCNEC